MYDLIYSTNDNPFLSEYGYIFFGIEASAVEFSKIAVGPLDWDYTKCD